MIKAVVVNSQQQDRDKIVDILSDHANIKVVARGRDAYDALKLIGSLKPDIAILDNNLEYIEGEEIPPLLKSRSPSTSIVILTTKISDDRIFKAASNQMSGILDKETDIAFLPSIINCVFEGGCYISPFIAARVLQLLAAQSRKFINVNDPYSNDPTRYLSKTELQVLTYIGDGYASSEIAQKMDLAVGTIRNYISAVMRKVGLNNRSQLTRYAFLHGLVPLESSRK